MKKMMMMIIIIGSDDLFTSLSPHFLASFEVAPS